MVVADKDCPPAFAAADLLSQAEHGVDSQVVFLTDHEPLMDQVREALGAQLDALPRKDIAAKALENSVMISVDTHSDLATIINEYAPEHLILAREDGFELSKSVINAGSVFIGYYTPESVGDYASGTNHTLPTYGYARMYGGVALEDFVKYVTFQELTPAGLENIAPTVEILAQAEELEGHRQAVVLRREHTHHKVPEGDE
jgi:histidinol dehydrogenase